MALVEAIIDEKLGGVVSPDDQNSQDSSNNEETANEEVNTSLISKHTGIIKQSNQVNATFSSQNIAIHNEINRLRTNWFL